MVRGLAKRFGPAEPVFDNVAFSIERGEFVCVIGHSGCGKTTILNILAGLERASAGEVTMDGREVSGPSLDRGVVFQGHALMPWLTVRGNIAFAVRSRWPDWNRGQVNAHVQRYIDLVRLTGNEDKKPAALSGGMKQRVGIARAFAIQAKMLLLDEPFGALDALTRGAIQDELVQICAEERQTVFMITHDVDEAILLADRILLMTNGPGARIAEVVVNTLAEGPHAPGHPPPPALLPHPQSPRRLPRAPFEAAAGRPGRGCGQRFVRSDLPGGNMKRSEAETAAIAAASYSRPMTREDVTDLIYSAKVQKGIKWADVARKVGESKEWVTAACLGQMTLDKAQAAKVGKIFDLPEPAIKLLQAVPYKGSLPTAVPTDPLIYRWYELVNVYGTTIKELIHEEFGDGIMSAIDFKMDITREADPKGDRVNVVLSGKFLPYKTY
jgi:nitrate/nitrite transport system ATP-binding protein